MGAAEFQYYHFITDNPFRLCGVSSDLTQSALRQKANATAKMAKVDMPVEMGLEEVFGGEDARRVEEIVRASVNDAEKRMLYRIFWPLAYDSQSTLLAALSDFDALAQETEDTPYHSQIVFLQQWFSFLIYDDSDNFESALSAFDTLYRDVAANALFTNILKQEEAASTDGALYAAQKQAIIHLLKTGCQSAAKLWNAKNYDAAVSILESVSESEFDEDLADRALRDFAAVGDREAAALRVPRQDYSWYPDRQGNDFAPARRLSRLAEVLKPSVPAAANWTTEVERYVDNIAAGIRKYANDAIERGENDEAKSALSFILAEPLASEWHEGASQDIACLDKTAKEAKRKAARQEAARKTAPQKPIPTPAPKNFIKDIGILFGTCCLVACCLVALFAMFISWLYPAQTISNAAIESPNATVEPSPSLYSPAPNIERRNRLEAEHKELGDHIDAMANNIDSEKSSIDQQQDELTQERNAIEMKRSALDLYNERSVDSFNERVEELRSKSHQLSEKIQSFNHHVNDYNDKVNRARVIEGALREMENR